MLSIIISQNGASKAELEQTAAAVTSTGIKDAVIIAASDIKGSIGAVAVAPNEGSFADRMNAAIKASGGDRIIFVDATSAPKNNLLQAGIGALSREKGSDISYLPLQLSDELVSFPTLAIEDLVEFIGSNPRWPTMLVSASKQALAKVMPLSGDSMGELMAQIMVKGVSSAMTISAADGSMPLGKNADDNALRLPKGSLSRLLQALCDQNNIEDLFPQHPWTEHEEESASTSYHELAAMFLRFGDIEGASQCLKLSDQFEDSPRSLALKAIISIRRGETLGAVANMVASLQQYEMRKYDGNKHYLSFSPLNAEVVSSDLQAGLTALNKSDNERALAHFAQAIVNFDPFYKEAGLDLGK